MRAIKILISNIYMPSIISGKIGKTKEQAEACSARTGIFYFGFEVLEPFVLAPVLSVVFAFWW